MNDRAHSLDHRLLLAQRGWMRALAAELISDPYACEDVVQDTLRVALERPPRATAPRALRSWLANVLRNRVRQRQRGEGLRRWHEARRARESHAVGAALDRRLELEGQLSEALRALPEPYREVIALRYLDGLAPRQIARRLGLSQSATHQRLSRGMARLRARLDERYGGRRDWCSLWIGWLAARPSPSRFLPTASWRLLAGSSLAAALPLVLWNETDAAAHALPAPRAVSLETHALPADLGWTPPRRVPLGSTETSAGAASGQDAQQDGEALPSVSSAVDTYLEPLVEADLFSGTVLLAQGGEVVHSKAYGKAHYGFDQKNTADTRFKLMSVTKSFTAVALMTLEQAGRVQLDESVGAYLQPWPEAWRAVTLRHLLSHTSGIPNLESEWGTQARQRRLRGLELWPAVAAEVEHTPLAASPGTRSSYSNFNYVLLGSVIEAVSGQTYGNYLRWAVLGPAGLKHTGNDNGSRPSGLSQGYFRGPQGELQEGQQDMSVIRAAGDLYSSTRDLYRLDRALCGDELLSAESRAAMYTPVNGNFALGWQVSRMHDRRCIHHSGGANGYVADFLRFPEQDACVIVLSNFAFAPVGRISADLSAILFGESYDQPARVDAETLAGFEGVYANPAQPDRALLVRRSGDLLMSIDVLRGQERCGGNLLVALGDGAFKLPWLDARLEFEPSAEGTEQPHKLRYRVGAQSTEMQRREVDAAAWRAAVGSYETQPRLGSAVAIVETTTGFELRIDEGWPERLDLLLVSDRQAIARPMETFGTQLHLERDAAGGVVGFRWERADGVTFQATRQP